MALGVMQNPEMRLVVHPKMRLAPSEVRSLSMLEVIQLNAFLDYIDANTPDPSKPRG